MFSSDVGGVFDQALEMLRAHGQNQAGVKVVLQAYFSVLRAGKKSRWSLAHTARRKSHREYFARLWGLSHLTWVQEVLFKPDLNLI